MIVINNNNKGVQKEDTSFGIMKKSFGLTCSFLALLVDHDHCENKMSKSNGVVRGTIVIRRMID